MRRSSAWVSARDWLTETFESERAHGLLAPWVLHTGLGPDAASSGFMAQVIGVAIQLGPWECKRMPPAKTSRAMDELKATRTSPLSGMP